MNCTPSNEIKYDPPFYKVVFFSSSPIWVPFLKEILKDKRFDLVWLVTMPDAPSWRGQKLRENIIVEELKNELKQFEEEKLDDEISEINFEDKKIKVFKPKKLKNNQKIIDELKKLNPDYFVVISYWKILPKEILDIPKFGPINIHWSILPKYRWASPIQSVFLNREKETWITLMYMDEWMDTGDIIKIMKFPLTEKDNAKTVIDKFVKYWPKFTNDTLWDFAKWKLSRIKQNNDEATYCWKFTKEDGHIDFMDQSADEIYSRYQAFYLWPWIYAYWNWKLVKFTEIEKDLFENNDILTGVVYEDKWEIKVKSKRWSIVVKKVKLEWKKEMNIKDFINWYKDFVWSRLN